MSQSYILNQESCSNIEIEKVLQKLDWDINDLQIMEDIEFWAKKSEISKFYKDKHILITGATGFMGIILVEKLLRACPDLSTMYLLLRPKKEENIHERMIKFFNQNLFDKVRR